uniref:Uncharacterized protein n=1 Tax=Rhizophora mucronata TaxID=61149 RepID=A0A2P2P3D9_RHIMU
MNTLMMEQESVMGSKILVHIPAKYMGAQHSTWKEIKPIVLVSCVLEPQNGRNFPILWGLKVI